MRKNIRYHSEQLLGSDMDDIFVEKVAKRSELTQAGSWESFTEFDLIIEGGTIIDGTGESAFTGDIGVKGERIAQIGDLTEMTAKRRIKAKGFYVCPGFIDVHTHTDLHALLYPNAESKNMQGITTDIGGLCGICVAPKGNGEKGDLYSLREYGEELEQSGNSTNLAMFVGNGNLRELLSDPNIKSPSNEDLEKMKGVLAQSMEEGAFGLSTGLTYVPSMHANIEELIELSKVVATYGGIYNSHMRNESESVVESVAEVIRIGSESGCHSHISHLKAMGDANSGKVKDCIALIDQANRKGLKITFDIYPYTAGSSGLKTLLPSWALDDQLELSEDRMLDQEDRILQDIQEGDWDCIIRNCGYENIVIGDGKSNPSYDGKSLYRLSEDLGISPIRVVFKILGDSGGEATMVYHAINEDDLQILMVHPSCMIGTDAFVRRFEGPSAAGKPHPRNYGAFPRYIQKYLLEEKKLPLEIGIRKITGLSADTFGIYQRGYLKPTYYADITVFDPLTIRETGGFLNPNSKPEGVIWVLVNGQIVVGDGKHLGISAGRLLKSNTANEGGRRNG